LTEDDHSKGHVRIYDRPTLEGDITGAGFRLLVSSGILLKPLSSKQMESWSLELIDALYQIGTELPDYCSSLLVVAE
jgi:hypothetical protein